MDKYLKDLKILKKEWTYFIKTNPLSTFEENKLEKIKLKEIILKIFNDQELLDAEKKELIESSVKLLSKFTGCSEDLFISREILNDLIDKNIVDEYVYEIFNNNSPVRRWF
ncbi:hypothetical protein [Flavobacterium aestivum]|uniref:hypothetical protein n=1 Tax=Flavobacterium aestivum TaxID=3003257 RepID=UPI0024821215|nr:hypothetical protein [Flavobacterium aestivum]